ncbi:hypothetical protein BC343_08605 [Mucilaginibacter pedocola]|uniref:Transglutaminase-like domain-containing protein n=1 Tax=Mucilaginibacter pedocola TaxID=1792845 RepID=A0A1S9PD74_9SPHI|nr:hypothetical protein BC343_08605 [Mucilaginibacter pedocola]
MFGLVFAFTSARADEQRICFEFYNGTFNSKIDKALILSVPLKLSQTTVKDFYRQMNAGNYAPVVDSLTAYKDRYQLNDWLYYQLIRKTAQQISPKADNYGRYTLYKWFLLAKSGYDARLAITGDDKVIFYVLNDEDITDIPSFNVEGQKYMCLNYHDYARANLNQNPPIPVNINIAEATKAFSYKVTRMPNFKASDYQEKELQFTYHHKAYYFNIKLNPEVETIFMNYPGVDFESYFNIPLSKETYSSLIPLLKQNMKGMSQKKGVDYLMHFTRYAFLYENDEENYGKEKRLSPEETLFAKYSDCDDRAALFFYLVKEIYNLPMIALLYPTHITMAVQFSKPAGGKPIMYKGQPYTVCEPTPQREDLRIGELSSKLKNVPYEVVYQYVPEGR